jgi:DNA anti-recombination protein RmuC
LDERSEALNQAVDQRLDALSRRFDELNLPLAELSRAVQQRTDAHNHSVNQRLDILGRAVDQRFDTFGQRLDAMSRSIDEQFATQYQRFDGVDVQLMRLGTNVARLLKQQAEVAEAPTRFRYVRWTLVILLALALGFGAKVIVDRLMLPIADLLGRVLS